MGEQIEFVNTTQGGGDIPTKPPVRKYKKKEEKKMAKQINFNYEGNDYTLEYTRRTVREMERKGFVATDVERMPMTMLPQLFEGAFLSKHRYLKKDKIEEIFDLFKNKDELIGKLAEMYNEPIMALVEDPEDNEKNVEWTATF